jgi:hypothetical protein
MIAAATPGRNNIDFASEITAFSLYDNGKARMIKV